MGILDKKLIPTVQEASKQPEVELKAAIYEDRDVLYLEAVRDAAKGDWGKAIRALRAEGKTGALLLGKEGHVRFLQFLESVSQ